VIRSHVVNFRRERWQKPDGDNTLAICKDRGEPQINGLARELAITMPPNDPTLRRLSHEFEPEPIRRGPVLRVYQELNTVLRPNQTRDGRLKRLGKAASFYFHQSGRAGHRCISSLITI
jgi:hypothetical protein